MSFIVHRLTAADCVLGYNIIWASLPEMKNGLLLEGRPNIKAYLERIKARPALQQALGIGEGCGDYSVMLTGLPTAFLPISQRQFRKTRKI